VKPAASQRAIAKVIGVHHSTVQEDFNGGNPPRHAENASSDDDANPTAGGNPPPRTADLSGAAAAQLVDRVSTKDQRSEQRATPRRASGS
jgi:hypothetical protein